MKSNVKRLAMLALGASAGFLVSAGGSALADDRGGWRQGGGHHGEWHRGRGGHGKMSRAFLRRYDANKDGEVTQEEIDANRVARHGKYDANGDGKLSLEEFQGLWMEAYRRQMVREFQQFDVDGDAAVTLDEYTEPMSDFVERHDRRRGGRGMRRGSDTPSGNTAPTE
jgi:hypothetical protein